MLLSQVLAANRKQFVSNFKEWKQLTISKNPDDMEILESYKKEFEPFKSESVEQYRNYYIKNHVLNIYNLEMDLTSEEIKKFFNNIFK